MKKTKKAPHLKYQHSKAALQEQITKNDQKKHTHKKNKTKSHKVLGEKSLHEINKKLIQTVCAFVIL